MIHFRRRVSSEPTLNTKNKSRDERKKKVKNPIVFQDEEEEEEEKEGTHKKKHLGFTSVVGFRVATHEGNKKKKSGRKRLRVRWSDKNDCHEYYYALSGAFNDEVVLFVTMSHKTS